MPDPTRNLVRTAPVTTLTTIESLVGGVLTFLATHHVFGDIDVSATTQTIAPFVALVLPAVFGALKWRLVTPVAKVKDLVERDGVVTDADFARISAIIEDMLQDREVEDEDDVPDHRPEHEAFDALDALDAPSSLPPRSMAAGG